MGVFKGLFVGVYASNSAIRVLFLPLCYLLLSTPFVLVLARYYRFDTRIKHYLFDERILTDLALQIFVLLVATLLPTRILSARPAGTTQDGKRRVQSLPYWVPGWRHWGNVVFGGERWLKKVRDASVTPIVGYNMAGTRHILVFNEKMLEQLLTDHKPQHANISNWIIIRNAFNMPAYMRDGYANIYPEFDNLVRRQLFVDAKMVELIACTTRDLSATLPDLVTFNSSIVDQMQWERIAGLDLTEETVEAECDLFALVNEFFCQAILPAIVGTPFLETYVLLASDLATFNQFFYPLALGLPRLWPLPGLPGAMLAKKRLLRNFERLFDELTNKPQKKVPEDDESLSGEETDAETPTPFTDFNELFTKHDVPIQARAAIALHQLHNLYAEVVPVAFWTILHIHATASGKSPELIESIRQETKAWAVAVQPPSIHPLFPAPPEISFAPDTRIIQTASFPILRSCIQETQRLYTSSSTTTLTTTKPITLTEPSGLGPGKPDEWNIEENSYIDYGISSSLINTSPANFLSPNTYQPLRFAASLAAQAPSDRPSQGRNVFHMALNLAFVAGVLQLWDISAAPKKSFRDHMQEATAAATGEKQPAASREKGVWTVPRAVDGAKVKVPKGDVRVRIRRREGLPGKPVMRMGGRNAPRG